MTDRRTQAIQLHNQALEVVKSDQQAAYRLITSAVAVDPTYAMGWYFLGNTNADLKVWAGCMAAYRRALECPDSDEPGGMTREIRVRCHENLAHRLYHSGQLKQSEHHTNMALSLDDNSAFGWMNMALILSTYGDHTPAVAAADRALKCSQSALMLTGCSFPYLFAGRFIEGLTLFESRFEYKLKEYDHWPYPRWKGGFVDRLLVTVEQGMGDGLSYARFIPAATECVGKVILRVQSELVRLLQDWLPDVDVRPFSVEFPAADAWCPIVSLPLPLNFTDAEYVSCAGLVPQFSGKPTTGWKVANRKTHIGIAWAGAPANDIDAFRSLQFTDFLRLLEVPDIQLYSVQVGDRVGELHAHGCAGVVKDLSPLIRDAEDTALLLQQMDMVITCDSFVGHLAGALGIETWLLMATHGADYRVGRFGDRPIWYNNTRVFRQEVEDPRWQPVWDKVVEALRCR